MPKAAVTPPPVSNSEAVSLLTYLLDRPITSTRILQTHDHYQEQVQVQIQFGEEPQVLPAEVIERLRAQQNYIQRLEEQVVDRQRQVEQLEEEVVVQNDTSSQETIGYEMRYDEERGVWVHEEEAENEVNSTATPLFGNRRAFGSLSTNVPAVEQQQQQQRERPTLRPPRFNPPRLPTTTQELTQPQPPQQQLSVPKRKRSAIPRHVNANWFDLTYALAPHNKNTAFYPTHSWQYAALRCILGPLFKGQVICDYRLWN
ncbi:hypothetical protein CYMTET_55591 [Cymbomonas tetramitiformis]|uniref:Uncharacterized protein n=1 Tax=Cymbomonas tetramitiformis TaxID=36881 RepID=A0AAE0BEI9_9CHLO|nr:hypothetical protein CYMTET_55591 [Cymbomonas tetramitiformis]